VDLINDFSRLIVEEEEFGPGVLEDVLDLIRLESVVDRHGDRTDSHCAQEHFEHRNRVRGVDGHFVVAFDTALPEHVPDPIDSLVESGVRNRRPSTLHWRHHYRFFSGNLYALRSASQLMVIPFIPLVFIPTHINHVVVLLI